MIKAVLFDLDGTLLYTLQDLCDSLNYALSINCLPIKSLEQTRLFVGNGIAKLIERALPLDKQDLFNKVFNDFNCHYKYHCYDKTLPYEGIIQLLSLLKDKGIKLAVVSNKSDYAVKIIIEHYFPNLFDEVVGVKENMNKKPSKDMVEYVLKKLQIDNSEALYIGDSDVDYQTAINGQMDVILVSYGFRRINELPKCDRIVDNVQQLQNEIISLISNKE